MTRQLNEYRVRLMAFDIWEIWITAASESAAEDEAKLIYETSGSTEFRHRDCGYDYVEAELRKPAEPPVGDASESAGAQ